MRNEEGNLKRYFKQISLYSLSNKAYSRMYSYPSFSWRELSESIEAKILFDVDKLDSPGCIRIARTFLFKGAIGEPIYSFKKDTFEIDYDAPSFIREYNFKLSKIGQ